MFEKVLVVEDHQTSSKAVAKIIEDLKIPFCEYLYYCDDALIRIKKELQTGQPFDLLITDISFIEDHRPQKLKSGLELIKAAKALQPHLKVIIFSVEGRPTPIKSYFQELEINGYVQKGRLDAIELSQAVLQAAQGKRYMPYQLKETLAPTNNFNFTDYDITVIKLLAQGKLLSEIPQILAELKITPSSKSSMEKRLNHIKTVLDFKKNEQLVAFCKDMGVF
ncbi:MAG: response regulator transcription factor [Pedobacter sp.]|nr:MAG: response regulator transcription factor [Pedobacter sp.]